MFAILMDLESRKMVPSPVHSVNSLKGQASCPPPKRPKVGTSGHSLKRR